MARKRNAWAKVGWDAALLGAESATVIGLRMAKLAAGGAAADRETELMISEKLQAATAVQALVWTGAFGLTAPGIASKTVAHYRRKVRANRRRLLKTTSF